MTGTATAVAGTNIALCKYWGKREAALNLPATGSLSLTLGELGTRTSVTFRDDGAADRVTLDGAPADERAAARVRAFLDLVRERAGLRLGADVTSANTVPTASGLASSASGFAALALAATRAAGLDLAPGELSGLARRGSGSAARSIFGGFVEAARGTRADGSDAVAAPILQGDGWAVRIVVAMADAGRKPVSSTDAMERAARTSPYFTAWVESTARDLEEARAAILVRDLARLGLVTERSCLRMHATTLSSEPPVIYWTSATLGAMHAIQDLRAAGIAAFFTVDAGPHVKVLCEAPDAAMVDAALRTVPGIVRTLVASPGPGARIVEGGS